MSQFPGNKPHFPGRVPASQPVSEACQTILDANPMRPELQYPTIERSDPVEVLLRPLPPTVHPFFADLTPLLVAALTDGNYEPAIAYTLANYLSVTPSDLRAKMDGISIFALLFLRAASYQEIFLVWNLDTINPVYRVLNPAFGRQDYLGPIFKRNEVLMEEKGYKIYGLFPKFYKALVHLHTAAQKQQADSPRQWLCQIDERRLPYIDPLFDRLPRVSQLQPGAVAAGFQELRDLLRIALWTGDFIVCQAKVSERMLHMRKEFFTALDTMKGLRGISFLELCVLRFLGDRPDKELAPQGDFERDSVLMLVSNLVDVRKDPILSRFPTNGKKMVIAGREVFDPVEILTWEKPDLVSALRELLGKDLPDLVDFLEATLPRR